jgi:hypothetical protein
MDSRSMRVIGVAVCTQIVAICVLFGLDVGATLTAQFGAMGAIGGMTAGVLSSGVYRPREGAEGWLLGDAVLNGSIATITATGTVVLVQASILLLGIRIQQGFWAPLIVGVLQTVNVATSLVASLLAGVFGAIFGHWAGNIAANPVSH